MRDSARTRGVLLAVSCCVLLALAGIAAATPADRVLVVREVDTGDPLVETPVENGTPVALTYTHSVEKTRVLDGYTVRGDRLVMTRMEFESYGWGLPSRATVETENGGFVFDPAYATRELVVKPGRIADHRLRVGPRTLDLVALSDAKAVRLSIERRSILERAIDALDI
jgi:hypothetical protein